MLVGHIPGDQVSANGPAATKVAVQWLAQSTAVCVKDVATGISTVIGADRGPTIGAGLAVLPDGKLVLEEVAPPEAVALVASPLCLVRGGLGDGTVQILHHGHVRLEADSEDAPNLCVGARRFTAFDLVCGHLRELLTRVGEILGGVVAAHVPQEWTFLVDQRLTSAEHDLLVAALASVGLPSAQIRDSFNVLDDAFPKRSRGCAIVRWDESGFGIFEKDGTIDVAPVWQPYLRVRGMGLPAVVAKVRERVQGDGGENRTTAARGTSSIMEREVASRFFSTGLGGVSRYEQSEGGWGSSAKPVGLSSDEAAALNAELIGRLRNALIAWIRERELTDVCVRLVGSGFANRHRVTAAELVLRDSGARVLSRAPASITLKTAVGAGEDDVRLAYEQIRFRLWDADEEEILKSDVDLTLPGPPPCILTSKILSAVVTPARDLTFRLFGRLPATPSDADLGSLDIPSQSIAAGQLRLRADVRVEADGSLRVELNDLENRRLVGSLSGLSCLVGEGDRAGSGSAAETDTF